MGKQFEQHGRYAGYTGLVVGLVPFAAACPLGFVKGTHIAHDIGLNQVCQVVAQVAGCSVGELLIVGVGIVDAECTDGGIIQGGSRIGVEGKGHVDGNVQPFFRRVHGRTSGKVIHPDTTAFIVVRVVILAVAF